MKSHTMRWARPHAIMARTAMCLSNAETDIIQILTVTVMKKYHDT